MSLISYEQVMTDPSFPARIVEDEEEGFVLWEPLTADLLQKALAEVLFALPMARGVFLPNPRRRFCLDLRDTRVQWFRSARTRKHLPEFNVVVKIHIRDGLREASRYHSERGAGNWLTEGIIQQLEDLSVAAHRDRDRAAAGGHAHQIKMYSFSLVERASGNVAATTFGFGSGCVFEDYTMSTFIRDHRSCGSILNKLVGSILQQIGYSIWYWGYEVAYMQEYTSHYGARHIDRKAFYDLWRPTRATFQQRPFSSVVLPEGVSLICEDGIE